MDATPEELSHARDRLAERDRDVAQSTVRIGLLFNILVLILCPLFTDGQLLSVFRAASAACAGIDAVWLVACRRREYVKAWGVTLVCNLILIGSFSYGLRLALLASNANDIIHMMGALMGLTPFLLILSPGRGFIPLVKAALFLAVSAVMIPWSALAQQWFLMYLACVLFGAGVARRSSNAAVREAVLMWRARRSELRAQGAKLERDIELAREIQDSLAPAASASMGEGILVHSAQFKYEKVAGDWSAVNRWSDGTLVMVVADATGKGMQAALVVHAIQSLWATVLDDERFEPEAWLQRCNGALRRLGEKRPHSATVGIVTLKGTRVTYYSAGHLPCYLLLGQAPGYTYRMLSSRGSMLGMGPNLKLSVHHIDVALTHPMRIVLCSDGVVERGSLAGKHDIEGVYLGFKERGAAYLTDLPAADDKTLIVAERAA